MKLLVYGIAFLILFLKTKYIIQMILGFVFSYCIFEFFIVNFVKSKFGMHFKTQHWKEYNNFIPK